MAVDRMWEFWRLNWRFGLRNIVRGLDYVRCLEYPLVFEHLDLEGGSWLLDFGSGHSIFPLYVAVNTSVRVVALDQSRWVQWQRAMAEKFRHKGLLTNNNLQVVIGDGRSLCFKDDQFDRISSISAIEHIEGDGDTAAVNELSRVLRPGGRLVLTVPFNYRRYKEFWISRNTYSSTYNGTPLFYQRHYDDDALWKRLIEPSRLDLVKKAVFGEPDVRFFNTMYANPRLPLVVKVAYLWLAPLFANRFLRVLDDEQIKTKETLPMVTAEGVMLVLEKRK